jgi:hypothetical protein
MKISYDLLNKDEVIMQASPLDEGILIIRYKLSKFWG